MDTFCYELLLEMDTNSTYITPMNNSTNTSHLAAWQDLVAAEGGIHAGLMAAHMLCHLT
jgi:hypothetical protein